MYILFVLKLLAFALLFAALLPSISYAAPTTAPPPQSTICGDIINSKYQVVLASDALACLTSVPFHQAVASRFLKYYNDTLQFHSTVKTLRNPPATYQQPAVDIVASFNQIQQDIDRGNFRNHYAFEIALQKVVHAIHDSHVSLIAGVSAAFSFGTSYSITSVSRDGIETPKVYLTGHLQAAQQRDPISLPPAIKLINGIDATKYLTDFAAINSYGMLEPHADWNLLMASPAAEIQNYYTVFEAGATFYPEESLAFTFENAVTTDPVPWLATYRGVGDPGAIATGADFFNFFVLDLYPASYYEQLNLVKTDPEERSPPVAKPESGPTRRASSAQSASQGWNHPAYPQNPDVVQTPLRASGSGGTITGYFLHDVSVGVLSIPSFFAYGENVQTFSDKIGEFLRLSKQNGLAKIVIDVQQNGGGIPLLAFDAFKQFFPSKDPFGGSRLRAHPPADVLGNTFTKFYEAQSTGSTSEWVATIRLNAETGQSFTSWDEAYGPKMHNGDYFTNTQRYNLDNYPFDLVVSGGIIPHGYDSSILPSTKYYEAEDIIILSDGVCSSACALFIEMMHHQGSVRTVVVGGQPVQGPMQTPSGTRGARAYSSYSLDVDMDFAKHVNSSTNGLLPDRSQNIILTFAGINLRDAVRKGQDVPLQFLYQAADCRIYYTLQTFYNYTNLWKYAADAIWKNPQLCVKGSTGYVTGGNQTDIKGPMHPSARNISQDVQNNLGIIKLNLSSDASNTPSGGVQLGFTGYYPDTTPGLNQICSDVGQPCNPRHLVCADVAGCSFEQPTTQKRCVQRCHGDRSTGIKTSCALGVECQDDPNIIEHDLSPFTFCEPKRVDPKVNIASPDLHLTSQAADNRVCYGLCLPPTPKCSVHLDEPYGGFGRFF